MKYILHGTPLTFCNVLNLWPRFGEELRLPLIELHLLPPVSQARGVRGGGAEFGHQTGGLGLTTQGIVEADPLENVPLKFCQYLIRLGKFREGFITNMRSMRLI